MSTFKPLVFWPPFILLLLAAVLGLAYPDFFIAVVTDINSWILNTFGWLFSLVTAIFLLLCIATYFSPFGQQVIGGKGAIPLLNKWKWFSITLCTTVATGILFWGVSEPLYHLHDPPPSEDLLPGSLSAMRFSFSKMHLHWSFMPYAIYTGAGLLFAYSFYNLKQPFSLSALLYPLQKKALRSPLSNTIDSICLFALVAGMAAALGSGILTLSSGIFEHFNQDYLSKSQWMPLVAIAIVLTFTMSAATGLLKGIKLLSQINIVIFIFLAGLIFYLGPTQFIIEEGLLSIKNFMVSLPQDILVDGIFYQEDWDKSWTTFYWANWMAWTPISALFLGRLSYGYTVKTYIRFNLLYPALFCILWMTIFSGTSLYFDYHHSPEILYSVLQSSGPEQVPFEVLNQLNFGAIVSVIFMISLFISFVTAADSNINAMSGLSSKGISIKQQESAVWIKLVWGLIVGTLSYVMVSTSGIEGIKMLSNLGGLPALILLIFVLGSLMKLIFKKYEP